MRTEASLFISGTSLAAGTGQRLAVTVCRGLLGYEYLPRRSIGRRRWT
jgi:hypothetical protein